MRWTRRSGSPVSLADRRAGGSSHAQGSFSRNYKDRRRPRDLTQQDTDAIVNAANSSLWAGRCGRAIHRAEDPRSSRSAEDRAENRAAPRR